jgi:hypothetical protein
MSAFVSYRPETAILLSANVSHICRRYERPQWVDTVEKARKMSIDGNGGFAGA